MKIYNYDIVYREIPDEVSLMLMISGCKEKCKFCHSPWLKLDVGEELNYNYLQNLIDKYKFSITTILFMGGEHVQTELIPFVKQVKENNLKSAWYCGKDEVENKELLSNLDYYKIGSYKHDKGPLNVKTTNQKLFLNKNNNIEDITYKFWEEEK